MWTSLKICSHCVAVAHCLDCTKDIIAWFTSHSKKLNLTKLSTNNVTKSVGKKPSQNRYSQRKATKPPILSCTLHSSFTSPPATTIDAPFLIHRVLHYLVCHLVINNSLFIQVGGVILILLGALRCQLLC